MQSLLTAIYSGPDLAAGGSDSEHARAVAFHHPTSSPVRASGPPPPPPPLRARGEDGVGGGRLRGRAAAGGVAKKGEAARRRQRPWWAEEKEEEGLRVWGLLGDAYDRCAKNKVNERHRSYILEMEERSRIVLMPILYFRSRCLST